MKWNNRYVWILVLCCYFAAVLVLCLAHPLQIQVPDRRILDIPIDKIVHFLMFFPYPVIAYTAFKPARYGKWRHIMVLITIFCTGVGLAMSTERLQGLSGYRSYEITDFYADVIGMECSALMIALCIIFKKEKREDNR